MGFLNRLGFYNALKLVSVAQLRGHLTPENVKHALSATSRIPAPKINMANTTSRIGNYKDSREVKWPKFAQSDIVKYAEIFSIMDKDKDGKITGEQARTLFLSWKIPKGKFSLNLC
jgi:epidermal growth factor receptor substrate 15